MRVAHRDVKPSNIFFDIAEREERHRLKLGDFGLAVPLDRCKQADRGVGSSSGFAGTPAYAAPEVVGGMSAGSAAADAWSAGCVLQELCTLAKAFQSSNLASLFRAIVHNQRTP